MRARRLRRHVALMAWLLAGVLAATPAAAQDRLFEGARELGAIGRFGQDLGPAPNVPLSQLAGGGRFAIRDSEAIDLRTGAVQSLAPGFVLSLDGARPRVFMGRADAIWLVDLATGFSYPFSPGPTADLSCQHAASADVLLCVSFRAPEQHDLVRVDAAGRHVLITTRFVFGVSPMPWIVTPDASRVYFARCQRPLGGVFCTTDLAMFDVASGELTTIDPLEPFGFGGTMFWDDLNERLFMSVNHTVVVMNRDLELLGSAFVGGRCHQIAISPHTGRLYVNRMDYYYGPSWSTLSAFDAATYRPVEAEVVRSAGESCGPLLVLTAPGAPRHVRASLAGHDLTLTWRNVGDASSFILDIGLAPGRTDLSVFLGPDAHASFANVPPGTYYLRLRGGNEFGGGRPSSEVRVEVR